MADAARWPSCQADRRVELLCETGVSRLLLSNGNDPPMCRFSLSFAPRSDTEEINDSFPVRDRVRDDSIPVERLAGSIGPGGAHRRPGSLSVLCLRQLRGLPHDQASPPRQSLDSRHDHGTRAQPSIRAIDSSARGKAPLLGSTLFAATGRIAERPRTLTSAHDGSVGLAGDGYASGCHDPRTAPRRRRRRPRSVPSLPHRAASAPSRPLSVTDCPHKVRFG